MIFEGLGIYVDIGKLLSRPNQTVSSLNQIARRIKITDDKVRRTLNQYSLVVGDPLISTKGRFIQLTDAGRKFLEYSIQFLVSVNHIPVSEAVDELHIGIDPGIDWRLLQGAIAAFLDEWSGGVALKLHSLPSGLLRDSIASGSIELGIGWPDGESTQADELGPALPWHILIADSHALAESPADGLISSERLAELGDRLFVPGFGGEGRLRQFLAKIPLANRVEVDSPHAIRAFVSAGLGIGLELAWGSEGDHDSSACLRLAVSAADPEQLCLYLPKNVAKATQPAACLIDLLRRLGDSTDDVAVANADAQAISA